ncbi:phage tail terminator family protein [Bacillus pseudomycoides]|uniref:phage tail terminator family protein n=2 Tax=Bacillus pseudomycoides TaxID=64104 RepID=UPI000BF91CB6|nr:hypothetical protein [Bacillus pseudomycoides]PFY57622.1 hypothetical protein COL49_15050 [Bacillus pseudomycoides]PGE00040.1 hypothetical protein COM50_07140 [Bacillus pseudomycoides]PHE19242.1 hypothetical protein COF59_08420 [Bacillus pseudomycoides]
MNTNYETENVMQTYEDALVAKLLEIFPTYDIFTAVSGQQLTDNCLVVDIRLSNLQRESESVQRRTIMTDIGVMSTEGEYAVENKLMSITHLSFGNITKVIKSARFNKVDGLYHLTFSIYLTEIL